MCVCVCVCIYIHTHTHIYIHTHTHIYIYIGTDPSLLKEKGKLNHGAIHCNTTQQIFKNHLHQFSQIISGEGQNMTSKPESFTQSLPPSISSGLIVFRCYISYIRATAFALNFYFSIIQCNLHTPDNMQALKSM